MANMVNATAAATIVFFLWVLLLPLSFTVAFTDPSFSSLHQRQWQCNHNRHYRNPFGRMNKMDSSSTTTTSTTTATSATSKDDNAFVWSQDENDKDSHAAEDDFLMRLAKDKNYLSDAKLIVFDKDGTLGDDSGSLKRWVSHMTTRLCQEITQNNNVVVQEFHNALGWDTVRNEVLPSAPLAAGTWQQQVDTTAKVLSRHGCTNPFFLAQQWHDELMNLHGGDNPLVPNLRHLLLECRFPVAVCTSDERASTNVALRQWNIDDILVGSLCGDEVQHPKPSGEPLQLLCRQVSSLTTTTTTTEEEVKPQQCIVVGDTSGDTGMARNAQALLCIAVLSGSGGSAQQLYDTGADVVIPNVGHIPALLRRLQQQEQEQQEPPPPQATKE